MSEGSEGQGRQRGQRERKREREKIRLYNDASISPAGSGLELSCCSLLHVVKRRLKGGVRGSLVAASAAARCQGPRVWGLGGAVVIDAAIGAHGRGSRRAH